MVPAEISKTLFNLTHVLFLLESGEASLIFAGLHSIRCFPLGKRESIFSSRRRISCSIRNILYRHRRRPMQNAAGGIDKRLDEQDDIRSGAYCSYCINLIGDIVS